VSNKLLRQKIEFIQLLDRIAKAIGMKQDIIIYFDILLSVFAIFLLILIKKSELRWINGFVKTKTRKIRRHRL